jgi:hypothetical protein
MKQALKSWWFGLIVILAFCAFFLWPLTRPGFFVSDDGEWMIIRLSAFYQSLAEGQFPVRFLGRLNHSYGYPVANFLYPGFLYIGALLHFIGFSFVASVKLILAASTVGASVVLFFLLRRFKYAALAAVGGVAAFLFSPYVGFNLYRRGSVGEMLGFFAAALTIYSLTARRMLLLPFAVAFLIVAHNTVALLVLGVCVLYILYKRMWDSVWYMALGVGLASFFWMPALFEQRYVPFATTIVADPAAYFPISAQLLSVSSAWILAALVLFFVPKKSEEKFFLFILLLAGFAASPASLFLWQLPLVAQLIQFPFRWLGVAALAAPIVVAGAIRGATKRGGILFVFFALIFIMSAIAAHARIDSINRQEGFYTTNEGTTTVADEYMPVWVREPPLARATSKVELVDGDAELVLVSATTQRIEATIEAETESVVQLNTMYYPGWGIIIDGIPEAIDYTHPQGLMRVTVPEGTHTLLAEFRETVARFAADVVSFLSLCGYIILLVLGFMRTRVQAKRRT